jgi:hypothetical protein
METIDEFICGDALEYGLVWADFTYYYVGARVDYPRYLCYDCHGFTTRVRPYSDVCLGFSISFVDYDPCLRPWSWWWWCSPARVYCGPRYVCHATKHYCSKKCGDRCDDKCDTYPSEYKWKSRHEAGGGGAQVVERFRAEDAVGRVAARGGNNVDATRFKQSESRGELDGARGLYSERDARARSADTGTRGGKVREGTASRATAAAGGSADRGREQLEADRNDRDDEEKADRTRDQKKSEARSERTKSKRGSSEGSIVKRALSSIAGSVVRSKGDSTDDKPKGKAPQVRQQGDKGKSQGTKSQATRRKVSR